MRVTRLKIEAQSRENRIAKVDSRGDKYVDKLDSFSDVVSAYKRSVSVRITAVTLT